MVNPYFHQPGLEQRKWWEIALESAFSWIRTHQEQFWTIAGTVAVVTVLLVMITQHHRKENDEAWAQLGTPQSLLMQNRYEEAGKSLDQWMGRFHGTSADSYAQFLKADLLYGTSNYAEASKTYANLAEHGMPAAVRPLALSAEATAEEMAGRYPQAQNIAQQFIALYPDHFLAGPMWISQARLLELAGNAAGAIATYDRFALLYPQSPFTAFARSRRDLLVGASPKK